MSLLVLSLLACRNLPVEDGQQIGPLTTIDDGFVSAFLMTSDDGAVLFDTANDEKARAVIEALEAGVCGYILKDDDYVSRIDAIVRDLADGRLYLSPQAYEALAHTMRVQKIHVPALRPTNYARNVFHVSSALLSLILGGVALVAVAVWIFGKLPEELVPTEDRGTGFGIVIAPEGATLEYTDRYQSQIEDILLNLPERRGLFEREALAVAALNHPNIVTIHSIEESPEGHYITMELVEGESLQDVLDRELDEPDLQRQE